MAGRPERDRPLLVRPLVRLTSFAVRYPGITLGISFALAILALGLTAARLEFRTSRLHLLNPNSGYNKLWLEYIHEFGDEDDVVVLVDGPDRDTVVPVLDDLARMLARHSDSFHAVLHKVDLQRLRDKGLFYAEQQDLERTERFLDQVDPVLRGDWSLVNVNNLLGGISYQLAQDRQAPPGQATELTLAGLRSALRGQGSYQSPWPAGNRSILQGESSNYFLADEGRLGMVLLRLDPGDLSFAPGTEALDRLRELLDGFQSEHPEVTVGVTGLPVMENDEMRSSQLAMTEASLLALVGVAILFAAGFGGLRHPLLAVVTLLVGMAWSFGYLTLFVGHLNILSVSFAVMLIGLGIDFGVHYISRYQQYRIEGYGCSAGLLGTARSVGPGLVAGVLTTAAAFFTAALTEFTGVAELGLIAGGGIILCGLAAVVLLPALVALSDQGDKTRTFARPVHIENWLGPVFRWPRLTLLASLLGTLGVSLGVGHLWYDHNLLNLQPSGLESVRWEERLLNETDQSVWYAISVADDVEELLARRAQFQALDSVERVEEIVSFVPGDVGSKRAIIERIRSRLPKPTETLPLIPIDAPELLDRRLAELTAVLSSRASSTRSLELIAEIRALLRKIPAAEFYRRLSRYQQDLAGDMHARLELLASSSNPQPPSFDDLPASLVERFVGNNGRYLLKIYGRGNIWDMGTLKQFVDDVRKVDPLATGKPLQTFEASRQMKECYQQAAWYALAAIVIVLLFDFRSLSHTLLAMVPSALGMLQMFGLMGLLDLPLNPANIIVLPLVLGIGVDDGVHILHDYRRSKGPYRTSSSTANAVLMTSLTSMVGFGSLMIADHRGIASLGRVMVLGLTACMLSSLVILPALLRWMSRNRAEASETETLPLEPAQHDSAAPFVELHRAA